MKQMYMSNNSKDVIRTLVGLKSRITPIHSRFTLVALSLCTLLLLGGFVTRAWGATATFNATNSSFSGSAPYTITQDSVTFSLNVPNWYNGGSGHFYIYTSNTTATIGWTPATGFTIAVTGVSLNGQNAREKHWTKWRTGISYIRSHTASDNTEVQISQSSTTTTYSYTTANNTNVFPSGNALGNSAYFKLRAEKGYKDANNENSYEYHINWATITYTVTPPAPTLKNGSSATRSQFVEGRENNTLTLTDYFKPFNSGVAMTYEVKKKNGSGVYETINSGYTITSNVFKATVVGEYQIFANSNATGAFNASAASPALAVTIEEVRPVTISVGSQELYVDDETTMTITEQLNTSQAVVFSYDEDFFDYNESTHVLTAKNDANASFSSTTKSIRVTQASDGVYAAVDMNINFTIKKYENTLTCSWGSWSKNVNFDSETGVTFSSDNDAVAPIVIEQQTGTTNATYDEDNNEIDAFHNIGSATWHVSQAEDYKYQAAVSKTLTVNVGTIPSPGCRVLVEKNQHAVGLYDNSGGLEYSLSCKGNMLYFKAGKYSDAATGELNVYGYNTLGTELFHETYGVGSLSTSGVDEEIDISNKEVVKIKFKAGNTISKWFSDVYVSRKVWLTLENEGGSGISEIDMPINTIGGNVTRNTFYIDYSTCASKIKLVSNNSRIKFAANNSTTYEFDVENGTRKAIELTYTSPADAEEIEATITVYTPYEHATLTVNAETMGKLPTTIEYIGADSYNVDHADMNATDLFQVRDQNGDLVASPAITLSSNNTSAINTVSSNTAIDFLCGADDVRITASYAGDATYAAASNSGTFYHDIDVIKLADAITWTIGSDADSKIHVWADSDVPNTIASSDYTSIATYSSNNSDRLSISGSAGSYSLHAGQKGEVTLTATSAGDCTYNVAEESKTIVVDPCRHDIVWNQNFKSLMTEEDGTIDQTIDLTAYAVDSNGVATNKAITYTLASTAFASIVDGTKLHITGAGETTITASTADDNKYDRASASLQVRVRRYGEGCNSEVADPNQHKVSYYTNRSGKEYPIPPSDTIYVKIGRKSNITCAYISIFGYDKDSVETELAKMNPDTLLDDGKNYIIPIDEKYRKIKFQATGRTGIDPVPGDGGTQYKWFSNLRITQKSYLRSSRANITNDRVHVYDAINETVVVSYSDKPLLNYRITGSHLTLTPSETVDNDCGDFGSYTFTVRGSYTTSGRFRDTIYITTTALDTLRIPIDFKVSPGTELYFQSSSGSWNTETKWTNETGVVQDQVPAHDNRVVIREAVTIDCQAEAYKVTIGEGGSVTIVPGGGLSVGAGGIDGATPKNLILKAGTEGATKGQTGYLRIAPEYAATMPQATVQFYSTVHYNTALSGDDAATYQCVGAPVAGVQAKTVFTPGSYLYTWDEGQDGWVSSRTKLTFEAFKGFEVTQKKAAAGFGFEYAGQLISVSGVKTIDLDYSYPEKGYNLLANSFTAPIEIAQFRAGDFINANQTIYILNAGTKNNSDNPGESVDAPGKWIGMPIATVEDLAESYPRMIAPMQGFWIKATGASPQLKLDYSRLVWGVDYSGDRANKPLRAPKRDAEMNEEMPITGKLQVSLYSETERDFFFMLESERYDAAYENGYDAPKIPSGSMDVFTVEGENELGVDATNSIIGTRVGVRTGGESVYTFVFSHLSGEHEWALYDHETGDKTDINEGTEYMFFAEPYSLLNGRFEIVERADAPSVTTGVDGADNEVKAYKFIKDNQLYILKNGVLYNVMGGVVR